jgi:hypothetical protein
MIQIDVGAGKITPDLIDHNDVTILVKYTNIDYQYINHCTNKVLGILKYFNNFLVFDNVDEYNQVTGLLRKLVINCQHE